MTIQVSSLGLLAFSPIYQAIAVHSPAHPDHIGSASSIGALDDTLLGNNSSKVASTTSSSLQATRGENIIPESCTYAPERSMPTSDTPQLRALAAYESLCGGAVFSSASFFVGTPTNASEATDQAMYVASKLKEFSRAGIKPVVFMEPTSPHGLIDMQSIASGAYDGFIVEFFSQLRAAGISDAQMGTWVPIPEGNIPVWTSLDPGLYRSAVIRMAKAQKKVFPSSQVSVLLDTITYPTSGVWSGGSAKSLLPYVTGIPSGLIDSVGLQGFPWVSRADQGAVTNGPVSSYLKPHLAIEAAQQLGVQKAWINSGTFAQKYTSASQKVTVSASDRKEQIDEILEAVSQLKSSGLRSSLHIFAENKLSVAEQTNWSYLPESTSSQHQAVFRHLAAQAHARGIELWLFDS